MADMFDDDAALENLVNSQLRDLVANGTVLDAVSERDLQVRLRRKIYEKTLNGIYYIPEGISSDEYVIDGSKSDQYFAASIALTVTALAVVMLRVYCRGILVKAFGLDDGLVVIAMVFAIGHCVLDTINYRVNYFGHHTIDALSLYPQSGHRSAQIGYISALLHCVALYFVKISLLIFVNRVLVSRAYKTFIRIMFIFLTVMHLVYFLVMVFQCSPPADFWIKFGMEVRGAKCISKAAIHYTFPLLNAITDIILWTLPIPAILKASLKTHEKFAAIGIFAIGAGACLASIYRLTVVKSYAAEVDPIYYGAKMTFVALVESTLAIICTGIPALRKVFISAMRYFIPNFSNSNEGNSGSRAHFSFRRGPPHIRKDFGHFLVSSPAESTDKMDFDLYQVQMPKNKYTAGKGNLTQVKAGRGGRRQSETDAIEMEGVLVTKEYEQKVEGDQLTRHYS